VYYTIVFFFFFMGHVRTKDFCVKEKYNVLFYTTLLYPLPLHNTKNIEEKKDNNVFRK